MRRARGPHTGIDTDAGRTDFNRHSWVYGWKPHLLVTKVLAIWTSTAVLIQRLLAAKRGL